MRTSEAGVLSAKPTERLDSLIPRLNKVSGLPVLDADGKVVGVISRKVSAMSICRCPPRTAKEAILNSTLRQMSVHAVHGADSKGT
jgi:CBS-domain-containing membrane protein